jgi:hypothetical protein
MAYENKIKINPLIITDMNFLAFSVASEFPLEVIYITPAKISIRRAM